MAFLLTCRYTLDGQPLAATYDSNALRDATLRLSMPGLRGGVRRSESKSELEKLSHAELKEKATAMGIEIRNGRAWRRKEELIEDIMSKVVQSQTSNRRFSGSLGSRSSHEVIDLDADADKDELADEYVEDARCSR